MRFYQKYSKAWKWCRTFRSITTTVTKDPERFSVETLPSIARCYGRISTPRMILLYAIRLYARMAKKYTTTVIPTHHARAIHISFPTGWFDSSARMVLTIEVTG